MTVHSISNKYAFFCILRGPTELLMLLLNYKCSPISASLMFTEYVVLCR